MLQLHDIRESRVYQEAREEGVKEGIEKGIERERQRAILKLAASKMSVPQIAAILEVDAEMVREVITRG